jgi:hypothetical protein
VSPSLAGRPATKPAVLAAALLVAQQVAAKAVRDAFFLTNFDVAALPSMTAAAAAASLVACLAFSRGMMVFSPARLLVASLGASATLFLAEWGLALTLPRAAAVALYLHHAVLGAALLSCFWSMLNERFDPHSAKRAMGAIGAGAGLGGVVGGLLTWGAASWVTVPAMLPALALASLLGLQSVRRLKQPRLGAPRREAQPAAATEALSGLRLIRRVPYLRSLALLVGLGAFLEALLDYVMNAAAAASFKGGAPLVSFFALFHGISGLVALLVQATLVRTALLRLGLAGTLALQPAFAALGAGLAAAFPRLWMLVLLRGGQSALRSSAFRSGYELLYTPLPHEQKRPSKVIVDVGCDRIGTMFGSGIVMLVLLVAPAAATRPLLAMAAVAAVLALALAPRLQRGYVGALAANLRAGAVTLEPASLVDPATLGTLASIQHLSVGLGGEPVDAPSLQTAAATTDPLLRAIADLRSGRRDRIRRVLEGPELDRALAGHVIPLLANDDLFATVATGLRRVGPRVTGQLVDAMLDTGQDPVVRRRIPRVLKGVPTQRSMDGLLEGLRAERLDVRYRCARALLRLKARHKELTVPAQAVLDAALREASLDTESERQVDQVFTLLALVLDRDPLVTALKALRSGDRGLRGTALEYLDNVLPATLREKLWPRLGGAARPAPSGRTADEIRDELLRSTTVAPRK